MYIRRATIEDVDLIHQLAHAIWWPAYKKILSPDQIEFMLNDMYSRESLETQLKEGVTFILAERDEQALGFASYSASHHSGFFKIHKLYLQPEQQGRGLGKQILNYIKEDVKAQGGKTLELNVNRNNPAKKFYEKHGFTVSFEIDIPYQHFILNDYVMKIDL